MQTKQTKLSEIKPNPNNPRVIKDHKFAQLVKSIQDFPEMLQIRPIVVNAEMVVLGGNMRLKACKEAGLKEVPVIFADSLTEEQQKEFIIKDNVGFGEWDWDQLANEWDEDELNEWGLDVPVDLKNNDTDINEEDIIEHEQSVQLLPGKEYLLIFFDSDQDFEQAKMDLKLKMVRRGGYKSGSDFDSVSLERVLEFNDFKERLC
jgi:hypothetical protein